MGATTMIVVFTASFLWMILYEKRKNSKHKQAKTEQRWQEAPMEPKMRPPAKGCLQNTIEIFLLSMLVFVALVVLVIVVATS